MAHFFPSGLDCPRTCPAGLAHWYFRKIKPGPCLVGAGPAQQAEDRPDPTHLQPTLNTISLQKKVSERLKLKLIRIIWTQFIHTQKSLSF